jgi:hypothetical protein
MLNRRAYSAEEHMFLVKIICHTASVIQVQPEVSCNFGAGNMQVLSLCVL